PSLICHNLNRNPNPPSPPWMPAPPKVDPWEWCGCVFKSEPIQHHRLTLRSWRLATKCDGNCWQQDQRSSPRFSSKSATNRTAQSAKSVRPPQITKKHVTFPGLVRSNRSEPYFGIDRENESKPHQTVSRTLSDLRAAGCLRRLL